MDSKAAVLTDARTLEIQHFETPEIGPDEGLVEIEACGVCGSDYLTYRGREDLDFFEYPAILGHEPVGRIETIGDEAREKWGVEEGDRVAIEPMAACGVCKWCTEGQRTVCPTRLTYGHTTTSVAPGLWGGYAEYMYLHPDTVLHRLPEDMSSEDATLFNPLGSGFEWGEPATEYGDTVLVLGPGQRGLACVIACREAGAKTIIVTGLNRDAKKLDLARTFGATHTVSVEAEDTVDRVDEITDGDGADVVIDTTPVPGPIGDGIEAIKPGGTLVLAGTKAGEPLSEFYSDEIVHKAVTIEGMFGVGYDAFEKAIAVIESGDYPLGKMHTHAFTIDDVERCLRILGGEIEDEVAIHSTIIPDH